MIPFDLEKALAGQPFGCRAWGRAVMVPHVIPAEYNNECPVIVKFETGQCEEYTRSGQYYGDMKDAKCDLYMLPVEVVKYANVYENSGNRSLWYIHNSIEQAKESAEPEVSGRVALTFSDGKLIKSEVIPL